MRQEPNIILVIFHRKKGNLPEIELFRVLGSSHSHEHTHSANGKWQIVHQAKNVVHVVLNIIFQVLLDNHLSLFKCNDRRAKSNHSITTGPPNTD